VSQKNNSTRIYTEKADKDWLFFPQRQLTFFAHLSVFIRVHPCPEKQVYRFWFVVIGSENNSSFKILNSKLIGIRVYPLVPLNSRQ
jgi:hypothetical protein